MRVTKLILPTLGALALTGAPVALASGTGGAALGGSSQKSKVRSSSSGSSTGTGTGGAGVAADQAPSTPSHPTVPGTVAKIIHGVAYAPAAAPAAVQQAIWAGNKIRHKPYVWGGGHGSFNDSGYDCSGSVSYVLHGGGLLSSPMDSSEFMSWGRRGLGQWITVYTNPSHAFIEIAGIRFDTSSEGDPHPTNESGPRWRPLLRDTHGFSARHPSAY